jgi:Mg-chelatase subunit ChlD
MSTIVINTDSQNSKILKELAERLGAKVMKLKDDQYEDLLLGALMESEKTGKNVSREMIFKKQKQK